MTLLVEDDLLAVQFIYALFLVEFVIHPAEVIVLVAVAIGCLQHFLMLC